MTHLPPTTQRRLQQLPQIPSVWEGDRRPIAHTQYSGEETDTHEGECIIWVDGSEGLVRSMDIVSPETGMEAVVRTLIRAMETPHSPGQPGRPQKIVVRNREIQFFLRGALQNLEIAIDYVPELPIIDELFRSFQAVNQSRPPALPSVCAPLLNKLATHLWNLAPWDELADYDIIAICLNHKGVNTLYACVMGMMDQEYGIIFYRSLESLEQFRTAALAQKVTEDLEQAFLSQDCWFLNYEAPDGLEDELESLRELSEEEVQIVFGSIHPYEGIRPFIDEEEGKTLCYALDGFLKFVEDHQEALGEDPVDEIAESYHLRHFPDFHTSPTLKVDVSTLPDLASRLLDMMDMAEDSSLTDFERLKLPIRDDLIPENAFLSLGMMPWEVMQDLQKSRKTYYQSLGVLAEQPNNSKKTSLNEGMPVILVQTSRPKAKKLIDTLISAGGVKGICFNPGQDPLSEIDYDLGILQVEKGDLFIFGEFMKEDPKHIEARRKWDHRCQATKGFCALIIAMGVTGNSRGNPRLADMLAVFEAEALDMKGLAIGVLQLMPTQTSD